MPRLPCSILLVESHPSRIDPPKRATHTARLKRLTPHMSKGFNCLTYKFLKLMQGDSKEKGLAAKRMEKRCDSCSFSTTVTL